MLQPYRRKITLQDPLSPRHAISRGQMELESWICWGASALLICLVMQTAGQNNDKRSRRPHVRLIKLFEHSKRILLDINPISPKRETLVSVLQYLETTVFSSLVETLRRPTLISLRFIITITSTCLTRPRVANQQGSDLKKKTNNLFKAVLSLSFSFT